MNLDITLQSDAAEASEVFVTGARPSPGGRWAVVRTKPRAEAWAATQLRSLGFTVFLPQYMARVRRHPKLDCGLRPLFSRYLFVLHAPGSPWTPIRYAPGVQGLIMCPDGLAYARIGDVEALQAGEAARHAGRRPGPERAPGDALRFVEGPFRGQECLVQEVNGGRARVVCMVLGALHVVSTPVDRLGDRP